MQELHEFEKKLKHVYIILAFMALLSVNLI
jgi:hypothetical protein